MADYYNELGVYDDEDMFARLKANVVNLITEDDDLVAANILEDMFRTGRIMHNNEIYLTNARQMAAMEEALTAMRLVRQSIEDGMSEDLFSIDLMTAYSALGRIIGEAVEDDLVEEIFSKFCLGK